MIELNIFHNFEFNKNWIFHDFKQIIILIFIHTHSEHIESYGTLRLSREKKREREKLNQNFK